MQETIPTRYESYHSSFDALIHPEASLRRLASGMVWTEGPVWLPEASALLWSDIPNNRMWRWHAREGVSVFREPSNFTNGHTLDNEGRLVSCEHGTRRVTRTEKNGDITVLVDNYQGKRLNSPNDVVVKSDGSIWFTDPPYGILSNREGYKADSELDNHCYVFRYDPLQDDLQIVARDRNKPNGLAFNLDESILYVSDTDERYELEGAYHIFAYDVLEGRRLSEGRAFAKLNPGMSDGFRLDMHGNIFTSSNDSIQVINPRGELIGKIHLPERSSNCVFGGNNKNQLFITATSSVYALELATQGAH